jgi:hypothetical protein
MSQKKKNQSLSKNEQHYAWLTYKAERRAALALVEQRRFLEIDAATSGDETPYEEAIKSLGLNWRNYE